MATHTREQFAWIVTQRATYVSPEAIVVEFAKRWKDTACELADVARADRDALPEDWQKFFDEQREAFLNSPTADKRVRIAELNRMFVVARDRNAIQTAAELLEQIAKEEAGAYAPKGVPGKVAPAADGSDEPIEEIRVTYVDPKAPEPVAVAE
jgi:hypothetical protein